MELETSPLVTVIVPVYNAEKYLTQCIRSITDQSYRKLEIILIDDGSPDNSGRICDEFAGQDDRIRVIHKKNAGSNLARETGLQLSSGEFILFVDSDDWIEPETIKRCLDSAQVNDSDCVLFSYIREYEDRHIDTYLFDNDFSYNEIESENRIHRRIVGLVNEELRKPQAVDSLSPICMKLYRAETAKKGRIISERTVGTSEDMVFNLYALENCRISYVNCCFYHYRKTNAGSLTTRYKRDIADKWDVLYEVILEYINHSEKKDQYMLPFYNRVSCGMIGLGLNEVSSDAGYFSQVSKIKKILEKPLYIKAFEQFDSSYCDAKWKLFFRLCKNKNAAALTLLLYTMNFLRSRI